MLSPYHFPYLVRYFDGIDLTVSKKMGRKVPPTETTLTEEFCALMDADQQRFERSLTFSADDLQHALSATGDVLDIDFKVAVHDHRGGMEQYVSQADFGLVLEYRNTAIASLDWKAAYLMQAKRLYPIPGGGYTTDSQFLGKSAAQGQRLNDLAGILGSPALRYWHYMPIPNGYDAGSTSVIRALHSHFFATEIFDYAVGLALHQTVQHNGGIDAGMWITDLTGPGKTALDIHTGAFRTSHPFAWFVLDHFSGLRRRSSSLPLNLQHAGGTSLAVERIAKIASGDRRAAQELIDELGDKARDKDFDPEKMTVLPAQSVTITLTSGPIERDRLHRERQPRD